MNRLRFVIPLMAFVVGIATAFTTNDSAPLTSARGIRPNDGVCVLGTLSAPSGVSCLTTNTQSRCRVEIQVMGEPWLTDRAYTAAGSCLASEELFYNVN